MPRAILGEAHIHPAIRETIANYHLDIVREVRERSLATMWWSLAWRKIHSRR